MRKLILILMMFGATVVNGAATYTEFYCNSTGTNINAGTDTNAAPLYDGVGGFWTNSTATWTAPGAVNLGAAGVVVGAFAAVCTNGQTNAVFIGRITAVDDALDTVQLSTVAAAGTAPVDDNVGVMRLRVGGAWFGAFKATGFPWTIANGTLTNVSYNVPRINICSGYSNSITAGIAQAGNGPIVYQGYTATPGDGGRGIIDAGGGNLSCLSVGGNHVTVMDMIFQNSLVGGYGATTAGTYDQFIRCCARNIGSSGFYFTGSGTAVECEAVNCVRANISPQAGFKIGSTPVSLSRCFSHDSPYGDGFYFNSHGYTMSACLSVSNALSGIQIGAAGATGLQNIRNCDSVSNALHGIYLSSASALDVYVENCNLIANRGYGITSATNALRVGYLVNNFFGAGTQANALGDLSPNIGATNGLSAIGSVSYAADATPYVAPSTGNFSLSTTATSYGQGRGTFLDLGHSGGTVSYPSVGAAGGTNAAGGGEHSHVFAQ